jgi:hypothetical protein
MYVYAIGSQKVPGKLLKILIPHILPSIQPFPAGEPITGGSFSISSGKHDKLIILGYKSTV